MNVETWLNDLGLGQYVEAFGTNDIDGETLASLDTDDLKELGVAITALATTGDGA